MEIYLDSAATTPVDAKVIAVIKKTGEKDYGNPSSMHKKGQQAKMILESARETLAKSIHAFPEEIYFTSGGTEANNLAIQGIVKASKKKEILASQIEHSSILKLCQQLEKEGCKVQYIAVNKHGFVNMQELENKLSDNTALVSVMHVNNEIGTIQNIQKIAELCAKKEVPFHTDAVQSFKKIPLDVKKMQLTALSLSAHKIYGPKGIGALYLKKGTAFQPLMYGGGQERNMRSGTENLPAIAGFAEAVKRSFPNKRIQQKKEYFIKKIKKEISGIQINGSEKHSVSTICNISIEGIDADLLVKHLSEQGIYIGLGSACASYRIKPSHVLKAIALTDLQARASIRISLSRNTTKKELDKTIKHLKDTITILRKL